MIKLIENNQEFVDVVCSIKGTSAANMTSTTEVKHLVKSKVTKIPFSQAFKGEIYCTKHENVFIGANYENAVNNQLIREDKEDNFVAEPLPWGEWHVPNKIIKHNEKFYIRYYSGMSANKADRTYHYSDYVELTEAELNLLFTEYMSEKKENDNQGTDKEIKPRSIKVESVESLKLGGVEYRKK